MKILLTTTKPDSPSFCFYAESLSRINESDLGATVIVKTDNNFVDYRGFDVALFMGGSDNSKVAKEKNRDLLCGVIEPRSSQNNDFNGTDFIVANSLEAQDFFAGICKHSFVYYTYPKVPPISGRRDNDALLLGYHGNKIHLEAMAPRITQSIQMLHQKIPVELYAMYNIGSLGKSKNICTQKLGFPVRHINYSKENYGRYIAHVDIGLVSQFIPTKSNRIFRYLLGSLTKKNNEKNDDFLCRFKETTNLGRHFIFAQYGIPVISDMTPSACSFIEHGYDGYVAYSTGGWSSALYNLASNSELRGLFGERLKNEWASNYSHDLLNRNLLIKLRKLKSVV